MAWRVIYTRTFLKEMARLPQNVRTRVEAIALGENIKIDPFLAGKIQKMTGYKTYYKIRVGNYRIGLQVHTGDQIVEFQRVLHRREIYRRFP